MRISPIQLKPLFGLQIDELLSIIDNPPETGGASPRQALFDAAVDLYDAGNPIARYFNENTNPQPLYRILKSIRLRWIAVGLLESPYLDLDFWKSHSSFYDLCFQDFPVECERAHFFTLISADGIVSALTNDQCASLATSLESGESFANLCVELPDLSYVGYCILRPTSSFVVGRTAIRFDSRPVEHWPKEVRQLPLESGGRPHLRAYQICSSNLTSNRLSLATAEFLQQDPFLGPCATASLWVATQINAYYIGLNRFDYSTTTRNALGTGLNDPTINITHGPDGPSSGLDVYEIRNAIEKTGARSLHFNVGTGIKPENEEARIRHKVCTFVDSGLPVLVCMGKHPNDDHTAHVVAAIGYCSPSPATAAKSLAPAATVLPVPDGKPVSKLHYLYSSAIQVYYAHDDRYGPFNRLSFDKGEHAIKEGHEKKQWKPSCENPHPSLTLGCKDPTGMCVLELVVPVPANVISGTWHHIYQTLTHFDCMIVEPLLAAREITDDYCFLWRSRLIEGAAFKNSLVCRNYHPQLTRWYSTLQLPKYVWLQEVSAFPTKADMIACFDHSVRADILGEYLYDPTSPSDNSKLLAARIGKLAYDYTNPDGWEVDVPESEVTYARYDSDETRDFRNSDLDNQLGKAR